MNNQEKLQRMLTKIDVQYMRKERDLRLPTLEEWAKFQEELEDVTERISDVRLELDVVAKSCEILRKMSLSLKAPWQPLDLATKIKKLNNLDIALRDRGEYYLAATFEKASIIQSEGKLTFAFENDNGSTLNYLETFYKVWMPLLKESFPEFARFEVRYEDVEDKV